jgi:hypothetical protein
MPAGARVVLPGKQTLLMGIGPSSAPSACLNRMRNTTSVVKIAGDTPAANRFAADTAATATLMFLVAEQAAAAADKVRSKR